MSQKWKHSMVSCFGCNSYSYKDFYIRKGQEILVADLKLSDELKLVKELSVADVFEEDQIEISDNVEDPTTQKRNKKGK